MGHKLFKSKIKIYAHRLLCVLCVCGEHAFPSLRPVPFPEWPRAQGQPTFAPSARHLEGTGSTQSKEVAMQGSCGGLVPIHRRQRGGKKPLAFLSERKFEVGKAGVATGPNQASLHGEMAGERLPPPGGKAGGRDPAFLRAQNPGLTHLPSPDLVSQNLHLLTQNAICVPVTSASLTKRSRCLCCSGHLGGSVS